jgi:hypothetical protein
MTGCSENRPETVVWNPERLVLKLSAEICSHSVEALIPLDSASMLPFDLHRAVCDPIIDKRRSKFVRTGRLNHTVWELADKSAANRSKAVVGQHLPWVRREAVVGPRQRHLMNGHNKIFDLNWLVSRCWRTAITRLYDLKLDWGSHRLMHHHGISTDNKPIYAGSKT